MVNAFEILWWSLCSTCPHVTFPGLAWKFLAWRVRFSWPGLAWPFQLYSIFRLFLFFGWPYGWQLCELPGSTRDFSGRCAIVLHLHLATVPDIVQCIEYSNLLLVMLPHLGPLISEFCEQRNEVIVHALSFIYNHVVSGSKFAASVAFGRCFQSDSRTIGGANCSDPQRQAQAYFSAE